MTYGEAIKSINALNAVCGKKDLYDAEFESALALAIEALYKQIPKKPYDIVCCPLCKIEVELQPIDTEQVTYCLHCGQAIDWRDDE